MQNSKYNLITVLGATAGGKTSLAVNLAHELDSEIISADSRQVYRGMDIGTGKDIEEYEFEGKKIPHHLLDILDAGEKYNVFLYQKDFLKAFEEVKNKGKLPILCGGTGMYIEAVLKGYKLIQVPDNLELREKLENKSLEELSQILTSYKRMHNSSDIDTKKRAIRAIEIEDYYQNNPEFTTDYPDINSLLIGVKFDRDSRRRRITQRLKQRLDEGMVEEAQKLLNSGVPAETLIYYGLEYKFLTLYLTKQISYNEMVEKLNTAIHQFAKRQMTWFRRMEKNGFKIHWLDGYAPMNEKTERVLNLIY